VTDYYVDGAAGNDANAGTSPGAAKQTIQAGLNLLANGDTLYVKASATYLISATLTFPTGPTYTSVTRVAGYGTTTGDGVMPVVRANAASISIFTLAQGGCILDTLDIDGDSQSGVTGVTVSGNYNACAVFNCKVRNCPTAGINLSTGQNGASRCEVTGCGTGISLVTGAQATDCYVHDNTGIGINGGAFSDMWVDRCVVSGNGSYGIYIGYSSMIRNCVVYNNVGDGIMITQNYIGIIGTILGNIIASNGGYGITCIISPVAAPVTHPGIDYNAFYSNTSGARQYLNAGAHDVTLTGNPFTDAASGDFSLNNTAGAGAACRAAGYPGAFPGGLTTGYPDIGAAQHYEPTDAEVAAAVWAYLDRTLTG
jgi:hypothetical protein